MAWKAAAAAALLVLLALRGAAAQEATGEPTVTEAPNGTTTVVGTVAPVSPVT